MGGKARENRWVFSFDLKTSSVSAALTRRGRLFQSLGAAAEKALSPLVFSLVLGTTSRDWSADLRDLEGVWRCSSSKM